MHLQETNRLKQPTNKMTDPTATTSSAAASSSSAAADQSADPNKANLILRFEYDGQQYELSSLTLSDTIGNLRAVICSMLNIDDFDRIILKTLQPTRIIDASYDSKLLSEIFRGTRERIVVEEVQRSADSQSDIYSRHQQSTSSAAPSSRFQQPHSSKPSTKHHKSDQETHHFQATDSEFNTPESVASHLNNESLLNQSAATSNSTDSPNRQRKLPKEQNDFPVCSSTGYLLRHPVPSNNSCLFISVHFCLTHGIVDDLIGKSMRKIIADTVASDKQHFDDAFLAKSNAEYCQWILDDNNWGGAIELSILCKYYETEIVAIDVKNTILNRFGEDSHYQQRMLLLYDGLHYDPLKFQPLDDSQPIQTLFSTDNLEVLHLAEELAKEAKQSHQFTDLKTLVMKCTTCNMDLDPKTASEHAAKTGHYNFVEKS